MKTLIQTSYRAGGLPITISTEAQKQYLKSFDAFAVTHRAAIEARQELEELTATRLDKQ